ncbi:MAG: NAD-binding protein [Clostridia bacterium]|nr:NAD-binding protein [Clostridia bacterium]
MHVLVVGCGRIGARLAEDLANNGHEVVIIDPDPQSVYRLSWNFKGKFLVGNGSDEDVLKEAGVERADVLTAVTDKDNTNIMVCQIAQRLFKVPKVIARVNDPDSTQIFHQLGLETVCLTSLCANFLKEAIL